MRRILLTVILTCLFFLCEFVFFNLFGRWFKPNLLILLVIYFNLAFGIRFGLLAAVIAGLWKDAFSINVFGINTFSFILCAYLIVFIKSYLNVVDPRSSRVFLVIIVTVCHVIISYCLNLMFNDYDAGQAFVVVMLPEVVATALVSGFVFRELRKCVLKLSA